MKNFRIAKLLEEEEPKTRGKSLFRFEENEKLEFERMKLEKKLAKQEQSKKRFEIKTKDLDQKIKKSQDRISLAKTAHQYHQIEQDTQLKLMLNEKNGFFL